MHLVYIAEVLYPYDFFSRYYYVVLLYNNKKSEATETLFSPGLS